MKIFKRLKFKIGDATQLSIALISSYGMWAATGFQKSVSALIYPILGFVTGGLSAHHSSSDPGVMPKEHIETPYVNNYKVTGEDQTAPLDQPVQTYQNVKIIPKTPDSGTENATGGEHFSI